MTLPRLDDPYRQPEHHEIGIVRIKEGLISAFDTWVDFSLSAHCKRFGLHPRHQHRTSYGIPVGANAHTASARKIDRDPCKKPEVNDPMRYRPLKVVSTLPQIDVLEALCHTLVEMRLQGRLEVERHHDGHALVFPLTMFDDPPIHLRFDPQVLAVDYEYLVSIEPRARPTSLEQVAK